MPALSWPFSTGYAASQIGDIATEPIIAVLTSDVDAGRPKVRALRSKADRLMTCRTVLTGTEKATFDSWYQDTARCGTLPFEWTDETGTTVLMRFEKVPQASLLVGDSDSAKVRWTLQMQLRILTP